MLYEVITAFALRFYGRTTDVCPAYVLLDRLCTDDGNTARIFGRHHRRVNGSFLRLLVWAEPGSSPGLHLAITADH